MKIIKAKVYYKRTAGRTTYRDSEFEGYPACWERITSIEAIWTNEIGVQEFSDVDGTYQIWLLKLSDVDYDIAIDDPQFYAISEAEAETISTDIDRNAAGEEITDEAILWRLLIKSSRGKPLSVDEEHALDPDNPAKGINRKKTFMNKHAITW